MGQRHRLSVSGDRGAIPVVAAILGALTVMTATAAVLVGVVLHKAHKNNPQGFSISVTKSTAARDTNDEPVIIVSYRLNFVSVAAVQGQKSQAHVFCQGKERGGAARGFSSPDDQFDVKNVYQFGESVMAPGPTFHDLTGPVGIACFLQIDGNTIGSARGDDVVVPMPAPAPTSTSPADLAGLAGKYSVSFTYSVGSQTDCVVDGTREFTVTVPNSNMIHLALTSEDGFDSKIDSGLKFAGSIALNPGFTDYYGEMHGQFAHTANGIQVAGLMITTTPSCTFVFNGAQE